MRSTRAGADHLAGVRAESGQRPATITPEPRRRRTDRTAAQAMRNPVRFRPAQVGHPQTAGLPGVQRKAVLRAVIRAVEVLRALKPFVTSVTRFVAHPFEQFRFLRLAHRHEIPRDL